MLTPQSIQNKKIIVLVPTHNEGSVLRQSVEPLLQQMPLQVVIIDDGSHQPAVKQVQGLPVVVLRHKVNLGQGAALQTGITYARKANADYVITFDADGQHAASDLPALLQPLLRNEADIVLGSRFINGHSNSVPLFKKGILHAARFINYSFTGILLSDAHNGIRAFNKTALDKISLTENRMAHASEILFLIKKHRLRYKEVPVTVRYTRYARQKGQGGGSAIKILFDLLLHKLFK